MHRPLEDERISFGRPDSPACSTAFFFCTVNILFFHNLVNLPPFHTFYATYDKRQDTTMSTQRPQYSVTISSVYPTESFKTDVSVQWTKYPEVAPRVYPTPGDAASALGWTQVKTVYEATDTGLVLHTLTPIDYDEEGERSLESKLVSCIHLSPRHAPSLACRASFIIRMY